MLADGRRSLRLPLAVTSALLALGFAVDAGLVGGDPGLGNDWGPVALAADALRNDGLNRIDVERMERGYYEALIDVGRRLDDPTVDVARPSPDDEPFGRLGGLADSVDDVRELVLKPNHSVVHAGGIWTTSSRGLRDREYAPTRPPGTVRLALLGDSIGAGWGVDDDATFEAILERDLDARWRAEGGPAVEILNFAVPSLAPGQRWETFLRADGWELGIDLVIYEATPADLGWDERRLRALLPRGIGPDAPVYRETLARLGIRGGGSPEDYKRLLRPYRGALLEGVYRQIAADCASRGVPCLWVLIPRVGKAYDADERADLIALAREAGFDAVIDLSDTFAGLDPAALAVAPNDYHPNADGHARIARRLDAAFDDLPAWRALRAAGSARSFDQEDRPE